MMTSKAKRAGTLLVEVVLATTIVGLMVGYHLSGIRLGISRNWGALLGETLIVFINLFAFLRKRGSSTWVWWVGTLALLSHSAIGATICLYIDDIPLVWFAVAAIIEILILLQIVERIASRKGSATDPTPSRSERAERS